MVLHSRCSKTLPGGQGPREGTGRSGTGRGRLGIRSSYLFPPLMKKLSRNSIKAASPIFSHCILGWTTAAASVEVISLGLLMSERINERLRNPFGPRGRPHAPNKPDIKRGVWHLSHQTEDDIKKHPLKNMVYRGTGPKLKPTLVQSVYFYHCRRA